MAYIQYTSINSSPTAEYPGDKKVTFAPNSSSQDQKRGYLTCLRTKNALLALCCAQVGLLGLAEGIVSMEIIQHGREVPATTFLGLWNSFLAMSRFQNCLWMAFTTLDVVTLCLMILETRRLRGSNSMGAMAPLRMWVVVCQMIIALIWVHGGAAWAMLKGPFVSTFGQGSDTVDYGFDVVVPLALTVTFFFTFTWNVSRFCKKIDAMFMESDFEDGKVEYEISL